MKKHFYLFLLICFNWAFSRNMPPEGITIEDIYSGKFYSKRPYEIYALKDGVHYTFLDIKEREWQILKKSYKEPSKEIILAKGSLFNDFVNFYKFSLDERYVLLEKSSISVFRYSRKSIYECVDLKFQEKFFLFDGKHIQNPSFSPDGSKVAFVYENNLYYQEVNSKAVRQLTKDGKQRFILNGLADWAYEEEFGLKEAFKWSEDSKVLAYLKFDESIVSSYFLNFYGGDQNPNRFDFKYPKAGQENSKVSVQIYFLDTQETFSLNLNHFYKEKYFYIPKLLFNKYTNSFWIITSNREQNELNVFDFDLKRRSLKNIFSYKDSHYIKTDELIIDPISKNEFVFACDKDEFRHFYLIGNKKFKPITKGNWEVDTYYGYEPRSKKIYYASSQEGSIYLGIYSIGIDGKNKRKLSLKKGNNEAYFSRDFKYFINKYSSSSSPSCYSIIETFKTKELYLLEGNAGLIKRLESLNLSGLEFFQIPPQRGASLDAWMIKPKQMDYKKKYPLLMYVYGGPSSKLVEDKWGGLDYFWFELLADKGYVVVAIDGRGTGRKGRKFEKEVIYKNLGHYELIDQVRAVRYLENLDFIDQRRIGIFGWSFGGYLASLAITKAPEIFKAAIAVAPIIDWRFYDTIYTEKYMGLPKENKEAYKVSSPLNYVQNLKGNYFIIQGDFDENVHPQNTFEMINALLRENKTFDMMLYPNNDHEIYGKGARVDLYNRMTNFLLNKL